MSLTWEEWGEMLEISRKLWGPKFEDSPSMPVQPVMVGFTPYTAPVVEEGDICR
jgi:hypothetical protein